MTDFSRDAAATGHGKTSYDELRGMLVEFWSELETESPTGLETKHALQFLAQAMESIAAR